MVVDDAQLATKALHIRWEVNQVAVGLAKGAVVIATMIANAVIQFA